MYRQARYSKSKSDISRNTWKVDTIALRVTLMGLPSIYRHQMNNLELWELIRSIGQLTLSSLRRLKLSSNLGEARTTPDYDHLSPL